MFQMMINEILQDLINTEEVVSFIDNIIVGIEEEKEYDRIVSQIRYSLVVIFELNSVPGVQYKDVIIIDDGKYQQE